MDEDNSKDKTVRQLVDEIVETLIRRYRIDAAVAKKNVEDVFRASKDLHKVFEKETTPEKIKRTRAFKDAVAAIKRNTYYGLRRYSTDQQTQTELIKQLARAVDPSAEEIKKLAAELAASHASTKERIKDADEFYRRLLDLIGSPETILDVGSGMQPLLFPFDSLADKYSLYLAADKDAASIAAVDAYGRARKDERLLAVNWDIREGWEPLLSRNGFNEFDVAFLFKLIPVVGRQKPEYLDILRKTPAKIWVLTGSKISLTKNQSIEKRERAALQRFIETTGCRTIAEFSAGEEFGFILQSR
jgi:16S rRNA (guanine(1405)-N(7))-methyltransferase